MRTDHGVSAAAEAGENNGEVSLLLFRVGGVRFGVEAGQVASVATPSRDEEQPVRLHELLEFGEPPARGAGQVILTLKTPADSTVRVIADAMEDMICARFEDIHPFPPTVERHALRKGMWGVLPLAGRMIVLMDFRLLPELSGTEKG